MHLNLVNTYTLTEEERNLKEDAFLVFVFVSKDASSFDGRIPQIRGGARRGHVSLVIVFVFVSSCIHSCILLWHT